jgi:hypothetical protein
MAHRRRFTGPRPIGTEVRTSDHTPLKEILARWGLLPRKPQVELPSPVDAIVRLLKEKQRAVERQTRSQRQPPNSRPNTTGRS